MATMRKRGPAPGPFKEMADKLWRRRRMLGMTQKDAAEALNIALRDLRRFESGSAAPGFALRSAIAGLLKQSEEELFDGVPLMPETPPRRRRGGGPRGSGNPVDVHVGTRLYQRRIERGLSQERLAEALGISFQQVQKYERGANRVSASRLYDLCEALDVDMNYFFKEMPSGVAARSPGNLPGLREEGEAYEPDRGGAKESGELLGAFRQIRSPALRRSLIDLAKSIAKLDERENAELGSKGAEKA